MALDPSIAMSAKQVVLDNPAEARYRNLLMQNQQAQFQQAQQAQQQERTLSDLYRNNVGADGAINRQGIMTGAAQSGLGSRIPVLQKQFAEADKATADVGHTGAQTEDLKWKTAKSKLDVAGAAFGSLLANPNVTHDEVVQAVVGLVNNGAMSQEQGQQAVKMLPGDPVRLRQFLVQKGMEVVDASKRMDLVAPKFDKVNTGKTTQFVDTNPYTNPGGPGALNMTTTPGEDQSAATARRGQNMADARARDANGIAATSARTQIVEGPDGFVLVDKGTGLARPAATLNGAQVQGKGSALNDTQSKALLFGSRMQEADKLLSGLAAQGVVRPSVIKNAAESVPFVGGALGSVANSVVASPQQQQVEQAQRDFINATLRRESGAAIAESEFENARKQYFPAVGDSKAVIQQKAQNRKLATQGIMAEVPPRQRGSITGTPPAVESAGVPADIAAILKKHGGK